MDSADPEPEAIAAVIAAVAAHGGLDYARERAQRLVCQAEDDLAVLPDSPARDSLRSALGFVLERRR